MLFIESNPYRVPLRVTGTLSLVLISAICPKEWGITMSVLVGRKTLLTWKKQVIWEDWSRGYGGWEPYCDCWLMASKRDWIPLLVCDLGRQPWSLDRNAAWLMTRFRLQFYEMLSRNSCRTVLAFLICRNCEMNASGTSKVLHSDSNEY